MTHPVFARFSSLTLVLAAGCSTAGIDLTGDGQTLTENARIKAGSYRISDPGNDGAVVIRGDGLTVDFGGAELVGCTDAQQPDEYSGKGIVIAGRNITLRNAKVRGYRAGIVAINCPGLTLEDIDASGNWQKHLLSTPEAEDGSDWMFAHENEDDRWMTEYGAAVYLRDSDDVTVRRVKVHHGQNGICIVNVNKSKLYDNDCSFISGWGLAMWKSSDNVITRNAFDFCMRGYSHGVYNRGQDSAGILMFEQNSRNIIAENSVTHGGDGFFGFAGLEALGDKPAPSPDFDHQRRGNNDNLLINNDFSYAAAHGIEMTFSFGNKFINNRMVENAICGIWGGYCQDTLIAGNTFEGNGDMGYGLERGGINIDSGRGNVIVKNTFRKNKAGIHFWGPPSADFMKKPWGKANQPKSENNLIAENIFEGDTLAIHLRGENEAAIVNNKYVGVGKELDASAESKVRTQANVEAVASFKYQAYGDTRPVGARKELRGRHNIIMTEWGPYDFSGALVYPRHALGGEKTLFQVLGPAGSYRVTKVEGNVEVEPTSGKLPGRVAVKAAGPGVYPFALAIEAGGKKLEARGTLVWADWSVQFFAWKDDPREHADSWKQLIGGKPIHEEKVTSIDYKWGGGPLGQGLPGNQFGTVATTSIELPAGTYKLGTVSDDGIRVWIDDKLVIDDWTWHPPKENNATVDLAAGKHSLRVEHFEIDGLAQLQVRLEPVRK